MARSNPQTGPGAMVCVAGPAGTCTLGVRDDDVEVMTYPHISVGNAAQLPRCIDVFVDEHLRHRVR